MDSEHYGQMVYHQLNDTSTYHGEEPSCEAKTMRANDNLKKF